MEGESEFVESNSRILFFDSGSEDLGVAREALSSFFPHAEIASVHSKSDYDSALKSDDFDIVILEQDIAPQTDLVEMLFKLKTEDHEPSVIVVAEQPTTTLVNNLYSFGCHRCIEKDERWIEELGTAVDSLIRIRKVSSENLLLRSKLTEANMLLHERNKRLDEFSATVAHDIRGPLGTVLMRLEYILDNSRTELSDRTELLIERAQGSVRRLVDLVQSTYEYAKLGEKATEMVEVNLEQLIHQVFEDLDFDEKLDIRVAIDDLPVVWANSGLLRRVFLNLISNAVKYNDKDTIVLHIGVSEFFSNSLGEYVKLFVKDNGPGIPEEEQSALFTIFQRGSSSEGKGEGSGVGLAVVKRILELHNGDVELQSSPGQGACFYLSMSVKPLDI